MGGSHLAGTLLQSMDEKIFIHHDYDTPRLPSEILEKSIFVLVSYSGNTEEVLHTFQALQSTSYPVAAITTGGELLKLAQVNEVPHIVLPNTGIQPRAALGYQLRAITHLLKHPTYDILGTLTSQEALSFEAQGANLAEQCLNKTPLICSSGENRGLAYYWKITLNETGKVPAFFNTFPECNHNELSGFNTGTNFNTPGSYHAIYLVDDTDHARIQKRMHISQQVLEEKDVTSSTLKLTGSSKIEKLLTACHIAQWCALHIAEQTQADPEAVPLIETFKRKLND